MTPQEAQKLVLSGDYVSDRKVYDELKKSGGRRITETNTHACTTGRRC